VIRVVRAMVVGLFLAVVIAALALAPGVLSSRVDFVYALF
jgi:hypothetical protein